MTEQYPSTHNNKSDQAYIYLRRAAKVLCLFALGNFSIHSVEASTATATAGQTVTLTVAANGSSPFTYQWYKDGVALAQSNAADYVLNAAAVADSGNYTARVSNSAGSTLSDIASLSVIQATVAPSIQSQPTAVTVASGAFASFSVNASGSGPLAYQWMKGGVTINGATSSTLSFAAAALSDAGSYSVKISNSAGTVISNVASLTVSLIAPPPVPVPVIPPPPGAPVFSDSSFETVNVGTNNFYSFAYDPIVSGWTYSGSAGITGNNSGFTSGNPAAPGGSQVAFIQQKGWMMTQVSFSAGTYTLSAYVANRMNYSTAAQTVIVYVDGAEVGRFSGGASYVQETSNPFTVTAGTHGISFVGQSPADATLFLDLLTINGGPAGVSVGNSGFETPDVGGNYFSAFQYAPATSAGTQDWMFIGNAGITGNNSGFSSGNPVAPQGRQVAFVQTTGTIAQWLSFPAARNYQVSLSACQRLNWGQGAQTIQVYLDSVYIGSFTPVGGNYQSINLSFSTSAGGHQLIFKGTTTADCTAFLDDIRVQ